MTGQTGSAGAQSGRRAWGHHAGLSRAAVLSTALELVDRGGLRSLTMRRLGEALGVEAMTIYHYVPSKDALLDGVVEQVVARAAPADLSGDWQELLAAYARGLRDALEAHPEVLPLLLTRPAITPELLTIFDRAVAALGDGGFRPARSLQIVWAVTGFVIGGVGTARGPGVREESERVSLLGTLDLADYPALSEAVADSEGGDGTAGDDLFEVALRALITGFASEL